MSLPPDIDADSELHGRVAEVAGGGISRPAEGDRADVAGLAGKSFGAHDGRVRIEAFDRLAGGYTVVGGHKGQSDVVGNIHRNHSLRSRSTSYRPRE
jgi:hypothetical protein